MVALGLVMSVAWGEDRAVEAAAVGLGTALTEVIGVTGGGAVGLALEGPRCTGVTEECWTPLFGAAVGAGIGGTAGAFAAAGALPAAFGLNSGPSLGYAGLAAVSGATLGIVGALLRDEGVAQAGVVVGALGLPVGAAIGAATADERRPRGLPAAVVPAIGATPGARVVAVF